MIKVFDSEKLPKYKNNKFKSNQFFFLLSFKASTHKILINLVHVSSSLSPLFMLITFEVFFFQLRRDDNLVMRFRNKMRKVSTLIYKRQWIQEKYRIIITGKNSLIRLDCIFLLGTFYRFSGYAVLIFFLCIGKKK